MAGVLFNNIPGNIRVPFFHAEFQPGGTPYSQNARLLLVGQKLSTGVAAANQPVLVTDSAAEALFGKDSMLADMVRFARAQAPLQEIWALPLDDDAAGVKATGKITVSGAPVSQAGAMSVYIAGIRVRIAVLTTDTDTSIAAALVAAINATAGLPVTAAVNGTNAYECDLTARHKGATGNDILVDLGIVTEEGLLGQDLLTITAMSGGSGDPDMSTAFGNLGDEEFDWIASPYADANALGDASDLLNDVNGRWSWSKQIYGHYIGTHTGTVGALSTLGNARNDQHATIFPCRKFRSPPWQVAAAVGARAASHLQSPGASAELSRPLQTLELIGIKGPLAASDRLKITEKQTLLYDGVSTYYVHKDGSVRIERLITTYQSNAYGSADATYLDVNTMAQSMYGIRYIRQKVETHHGRKALADANPGRNPGIATADDVRNSIIHAYEDLVALGVFENADLFARDVVVERDLVDANRLNASLPLDHVNQLRIVAAAAVNHMQRREPRDSLAA
jgi:phage tail sheath gpL-like